MVRSEKWKSASGMSGQKRFNARDWIITKLWGRPGGKKTRENSPQSQLSYEFSESEETVRAF